jgi:hypothetical protein
MDRSIPAESVITTDLIARFRTKLASAKESQRLTTKRIEELGESK